MRHYPPRSLSAATAIAALLALGSTPVFAQDAAPTLDLPQATTTTAQPASPPPVVTPPAVAPAPQAATPTLTLPVDPPAARSGTAERAPAERAAARRETPRSAARQAQPARTAEAPAAPAAAAATVPVAAAPAPVVPPAPLPDVPIAAAPDASAAQPASTEPSRVGIAAAVAGLLAALGLGAAGIAATRARRRRNATMEDRAPEVVPIVATPPAEPARFPEGLRHAAQAPVRTAEPVARSAASMPDGAVPTGEARQALIDRMVAQAPDAENPFTSIKSRRKRARLILQAREARQAADASQPFDWRTYKPSDRKVDAEAPSPVTV